MIEHKIEKQIKKQSAKGEYYGYQLAIFCKSLQERRDFEKALDVAFQSLDVHGKMNYWGGMTHEQTKDFIKSWFE